MPDCPHCGTAFASRPAHSGGSNKVFCSTLCRSKVAYARRHDHKPSKKLAFAPGDHIEFWSKHQLRWLSGIVEPSYDGSTRVRIRTGPGVWIVRSAKVCRLAQEIRRAAP